MRILRLFHTVIHLKRQQVVYQILNRVYTPKYKLQKTPKVCGMVKMQRPIEKNKCSDGVGSFTFLNLSAQFAGWNDTRRGMLWAYNLNYMDWLLQEDMTADEGAKWIDRFVNDLPENRIGLDPYPIALRGLNWIKFFSVHAGGIKEPALQRWNDSLYAQYRLLSRKLEYHLMGNHLLEDAYSLFAASIYFHDHELYRKSLRLLKQQLYEQILPDGAHYEQSPMYHCILLDRLLDCLNLSQSNILFPHQEEFSKFLAERAIMMLGHLESICYQDDSYPLFNDSACGIAPTPAQLKQYAHRLGLNWEPLPLDACGYRHFKNERMEAFVDVGGITASYQPGHSHADALNFELRIDGKPFVVDTGISTYNKTERRQYERSTSAHNTVTIDGKDSSQVWGGFRVGGRAHVRIENESPRRVTAHLRGFGCGAEHQRTFTIEDRSFTVSDTVRGRGHSVSYLHLSPDVSILSCSAQQIVTSTARIELQGAVLVEAVREQASTAYNALKDITVVKISFDKQLTYTITL